MTNNDHVTQLIHQAIDESGEGDYAVAITTLSKAIALDPNSEQAFFERGMAYLELDNTSDAISDFDRALAIDSDYSGARDWRARALESQGNFAEAAEEKLKELRTHPEGIYDMGVSPQSWGDCASAYIAAGNQSKAKSLLEEYFSEHAQKVRDYKRDETTPMRILSGLLLQSGDNARALDFAKCAYESNHQVPADILTYALSLEAVGDMINAKQICAQAMSINDQMLGLKALNQRLTQ